MIFTIWKVDYLTSRVHHIKTEASYHHPAAPYTYQETKFKR